jgi:hypothetical protein
MSNQPQIQSTALSTYRGKGKVARLPNALRHQVNEMLLDGLPYAEIIQRLGEHGKHLKPGHLCEWKKRGYQQWLAEQAIIERLRIRQETTADIVRELHPTDVNQATLQLGTLHIFEAFRDLGPGALDEKLGCDTAGFARLLNALSRASRETKPGRLVPTGQWPK